MTSARSGVTPVSPDEYGAHRDGRLPEPELVADGIWTLPVANRRGHMPFTFCYLVEDATGGVHVVDPGWNLDANAATLSAALGRLGLGRRSPASVIVTHLHPDHMGLAGRLVEQHATPVVMHDRDEQAQRMYAAWALDEVAVRADLDAWGVPHDRYQEVLGYVIGTPRVVVPASLRVQDGDLLPVPGRRLRVLHSPGHTPGHLCLVEEEQRLLFTGDHLLPRVVPGLGSPGTFPENPLEVFLGSLARMSSYDDCQALPGHEYRYRGIADRARAIASRYLRRTAEVEPLLEDAPRATPWQVAERLSWGRGWEALDRHYLVSALRQTAMHIDLVRSGAHQVAFDAWGRPTVDPRS